jgi:SAM-dependent MidA family methyltransferase
MTYRGHAADGSPGAPYRDIGERDITAHVDTTTLVRLLETAGLARLGETTQAELLVGCGLEDLLERERSRTVDAAALLLLRSAVMRLLDPRHLGGFRAVLAGRAIAAAPPLRGLAYRSAVARSDG